MNIEIDLDSYLSIDNGKGILIRKQDEKLLKQLNIDIYEYDRIESLLNDLSSLEIDDELEELIDYLKEMHYYHETHK